MQVAQCLYEAASARLPGRVDRLKVVEDEQRAGGRPMDGHVAVAGGRESVYRLLQAEGGIQAEEARASLCKGLPLRPSPGQVLMTSATEKDM